MGLFDGFPFKSKEQAQREQKDFEKRVFPFGLEQREAARAVLAAVIPGQKHDNERLFAFISAKDNYILDEMSEEALNKSRAKLATMKWLSAEEIELVLALVRLDSAIQSLEDYPTPQQVTAASQPV